MPFTLRSLDFILFKDFLKPLNFCPRLATVSSLRLCDAADFVAMYLVRQIQLKTKEIRTAMGTKWNSGLIVSVTSQFVPGKMKLHCSVALSCTSRFMA